MTELERALAALAPAIDWPETPDLASRLSLPERTPGRRPRWALVVALALVAVLAAILAVPQSRSAFLRILHVGGEEIHIVGQLPTVTPQLNLEVALGRKTTLSGAERRVGFRIRVPDERPNAVYVARGNRSVTLLYGTPTSVRALVTESRGSVFQKFFTKSVTPGTKLEYLSVNGDPGGFISGHPHQVMQIRPDGVVFAETLRLARNVLIWSHGGIAYRIEGGFAKEQALELARQLR